MRHTDARIQQAQIIVDLGNRSYRGTGIVRSCFLVDGNCRREAFNGFDIRLFHPAEKHPGISAQRFHIAPLAFGIDRIKGEGRLAAAGKTGHDDHFVAGNFQGYILQVVFPGTADQHFIQFHPVSFHSFAFFALSFRSFNMTQASRGDRSSGLTPSSASMISSASLFSFFISTS